MIALFIFLRLEDITTITNFSCSQRYIVDPENCIKQRLPHKRSEWFGYVIPPISEANVLGRACPISEANILGRACPISEAGVLGRAYPISEANVLGNDLIDYNCELFLPKNHGAGQFIGRLLSAMQTFGPQK